MFYGSLLTTAKENGHISLKSVGILFPFLTFSQQPNRELKEFILLYPCSFLDWFQLFCRICFTSPLVKKTPSVKLFCPLLSPKLSAFRSILSLHFNFCKTQAILFQNAIEASSSAHSIRRQQLRTKQKQRFSGKSKKMIGPNFIDEIDCGNFFDHIDDLLDFPEDGEGGGLVGGNCDAFPSIWTNPSMALPGSGSDSVFSGNNSNSTTSDLSAELSVPYEDIVQLEWLSNFVEDSFSGGSITLDKENSSVNKDSSHNQFHTSSPVSVLESSSSCSGGKTMPRSPETAAPGRLGRARSKRPRPATFNPRPAIQLISPTSSVTETPQQQPFMSPKLELENFAESPPLLKIPKMMATAEHKKKKKMKLSLPLGPVEMNQNPPPSQAAVRKCMHCEITKTPQWRAGPMGPKTLCNACGVRYKSGRLFPEYRPAASPTFVPSLHSNSHKKVIEMRTKVGDKTTMAGTIAAAAAEETSTTPMEFIPNSNSLLDYM